MHDSLKKKKALNVACCTRFYYWVSTWLRIQPFIYLFSNKCSFQICVIYTLGGSDLLCSNSYVEWIPLLSSVILFVSHKCCKLNTLFLNYILKICKWNRSPLDPEARFPHCYTKWNSGYWKLCQLHCNRYSQK